jgi:hypothetical protein
MLCWRISCKRAQNGFEIVDELGEGGVFEGRAQAGRVEGDFHRGIGVDREAEAAGGVGRRGNRDQGTGDRRGDGCAGLAEEVHGFGGRRFGLWFAGLWVGLGGDLFGEGAGVFEDGDGEAAGKLQVVSCRLQVGG